MNRRTILLGAAVAPVAVPQSWRPATQYSQETMSFDQPVTCMTVHNGRLVVATGNTVHFIAPIDWSTTKVR